MKVVAEYEDGQLIRHRTETHDAGGGMNLTDIRCTCQGESAGCALHGKEAGDAAPVA
jgi:hypothetical protein